MALPFDVDGTWTNTPTYDAGELRRADAALFSSAGISSGLAVSVDGSDVVTITAGQVVISGEDAVAGTGVYRAGIASSVTGSLAARDATNSRIDLVVFRQMDTDVVPAHAAKTSRIQIIPGTPSATPAVPTRPSMAVELARITVPASGGGAASVNSANRVYAKPVDAGAGLPYAMAAGTGTISVTASTFGTATVTLPTGRFTAAPILTASAVGTSTFNVEVWAAPTTTSGQVMARHVDNASSTATVSFTWTAVQMTPTSGAG